MNDNVIIKINKIIPHIKDSALFKDTVKNLKEQVAYDIAKIITEDNLFNTEINSNHIGFKITFTININKPRINGKN